MNDMHFSSRARWFVAWMAMGAWSLWALLMPIRVWAHGPAIEVGESAKGPVTLSALQAKAIGLTLASADLRPLADLLTLNGEIQLLPDHTAEVSTRISGQVTALYVQLGDRVKVGQSLARVQSRLVGDPPPSVNVSSPKSGIVDTVNISVGRSVEPAATLFQISDRSVVNMVARIYEEDLGQDARIRTLSYPDRVFSGKVTLIGPSLDAQSRTAVVWFRLANPDGLLRPNLFAKAALVLKQNAAALAIPNAAILEANSERFVFVKQGDRYDRVDIVTGLADDQYTEVADGLVPGDEVVVQGIRELYTMWLTGGGKTKSEAPLGAKPAAQAQIAPKSAH
jgi:cobalt-zinc-cadmium efflux system membrane fusion protein